MSENKIKKLAVFCGSSLGFEEIYAQEARKLGSVLHQHQIGLVYGGASVGIMNEIANTVLTLGGEAIGVMPESLVKVEIAHKNLTHLHVTKSMHERKAVISDLSDGFILLPGGVGSLEEFFEVFTWSQLGYHQKPCGVLNIHGYFDGLLQFLNHTVASGFVKQAHLDSIIVEQDPEKLIQRFQNYSPVIETKWIKKKSEL